MNNKKQHTNEVSARIVGVGADTIIWGYVNPGPGQSPAFAGLPAWGSGTPKFFDSGYNLQFLVDENSVVWLRINQIVYNPLSVLPNEYPVITRIHNGNFNWGPGYGNTDPGNTTPIWDININATSGTFSYDTGSLHIPLTPDDFGPGKRETVSTDEGWVRWVYLWELPHGPEGSHIWLGARGHYDSEEAAINPTPQEFILDESVVPWDYYPCSVYNNTDNSFVPCNNPGHGLGIYDSSTGQFRDIKNYDYDSGDNKGLLYYNNSWNKIAKG